MAGLFRKVYDWLLRTFWLVPSHSRWVLRQEARNDAFCTAFRNSFRPSDTPLTPTLDRATEMDVTMIGLQNAGKTSLLRVLSVRLPSHCWSLASFRLG